MQLKSLSVALLLTLCVCPVWAFTVTFTDDSGSISVDAPDAVQDEVKDKVFTIIKRYKEQTADVYDTQKKAALDADITALREKIKPTPIVVEPEPIEEPITEDILEAGINWEDIEVIR